MKEAKIRLVLGPRMGITRSRRLLGRTFLPPKGQTYLIWAFEGQKGVEMLDTLYHEFTHFLISFFKLKVKNKAEEQICRTMGYISSLLFSDLLIRNGTRQQRSR